MLYMYVRELPINYLPDVPNRLSRALPSLPAKYLKLNRRNLDLERRQAKLKRRNRYIKRRNRHLKRRIATLNDGLLP